MQKLFSYHWYDMEMDGYGYEMLINKFNTEETKGQCCKYRMFLKFLIFALNFVLYYACYNNNASLSNCL